MLASVLDNEILAATLPNVIAHEIVDYSGWTHGDFVVGIDADILVYWKIIDKMNEMNQNWK